MVMGRSALSASLQMISNGEEWLIHQVVVLQYFARLVKWTGRNLMKLNKGKREALHVGRRNPVYRSVQGG